MKSKAFQKVYGIRFFRLLYFIVFCFCFLDYSSSKRSKVKSINRKQQTLEAFEFKKTCFHIKKLFTRYRNNIRAHSKK